MFGGDPRRSYSPDMAPLTLILNSIFKLIFKKIFHSQNPHRAFYCGKLGPVNHPPPKKTINFIQLKHSMDRAWHFDEITPSLRIIYELPPLCLLLLLHHCALPAGVGVVLGL